MCNEFYDEQKINSAVKTTIITKYFNAWAKIMTGQVAKGRIRYFAYIDLYSGPGVYKDESESTPIQITRICAQDEKLCDTCYLYFNDKNAKSIEGLRSNIENRGLSKKVKHINYSAVELNSESGLDLVSPNCPAFSFIDPFGYAGLTMPLLQTLLGSWGSDLVFFFNINRITGRSFFTR